MSLTFDSKNFLMGGTPFFLNSGEIHYFRIPVNSWEQHLQKAKNAGLNTVCTYIPWDWHEYECGQFDFSGKTHPQRDLKSWIDLCQKNDLFLIVKPGPFILAEYRGAGIPEWFIERFGSECFVKNSLGETFETECMTFCDSTYLEYVQKWYDQIIPFLADRKIDRSGPIIMAQVCNEIGVFTWLTKQADYNVICIEKYRYFLEKKYSSIAEVNQMYGTDFKDFQNIVPPSDDRQKLTSLCEMAQFVDWHDFWRSYYADYLNFLIDAMHQRGLDVPLYHNLPGWIYGRGTEFPVNITMYSELYRQKSPQILFGVDHIPEYCSYRNAHDSRMINDITRAMMGYQKPLFGAEFQSGSREYSVVPSVREMALFYKSSLIHGLKGWNYYMFSSGKNQRGKGFSGTDFYWHCPLNEKAEEGVSYSLVSDTSVLVDSLKDYFLHTERVSEICVLFYDPNYATELESPVDLNSCHLHWQMSQMRSSSYFDGLLRALHIQNIDFDIVDLRSCSQEDLSSYKQVWFFSTEMCDAKSQEKLLDYMSCGGQLIFYPTVPFMDLHGRTCSLLRDSLQMSKKDLILEKMSPLIDCLGTEDIKCFNPISAFDSKFKRIAELDGHSVGCRIPFSQGEAIVLGFCLGFDTEKHLEMYEGFCRLSSARLRWAETSNQKISLQQNFSHDDRVGLLFIGNYHNSKESFSMTYTHPVTKEKIRLPYSSETMQIPQTYGILTPICKELDRGIVLLHTTSDLRKCLKDKKRNCIDIHLKGDRDLSGEMLLEGSSLSKIDHYSIDGKVFDIVIQENRAVLSYIHSNEEPFVLTLWF